MNLIERAKNILLTPAKEWDVIKGENLTIVDMFTKYAMILAVIPAVAGFIGFVVIGVSYGFGLNIHWPVGTALVWMILSYALSLGGVFLLAFIIDTLAPTFGCTKNLQAAVKIAVYSFTAVWVVGILAIIPVLSILLWVGILYTGYLIYLGIQKLKEPTQDKLIPYFVVSIVALILIYWFVGFIVARIALGSMTSLAGGLGSF